MWPLGWRWWRWWRWENGQTLTCTIYPLSLLLHPFVQHRHLRRVPLPFVWLRVCHLFTGASCKPQIAGENLCKRPLSAPLLVPKITPTPYSHQTSECGPPPSHTHRNSSSFWMQKSASSSTTRKISGFVHLMGNHLSFGPSQVRTCRPFPAQGARTLTRPPNSYSSMLFALVSCAGKVGVSNANTNLNTPHSPTAPQPHSPPAPTVPTAPQHNTPHNTKKTQEWFLPPPPTPPLLLSSKQSRYAAVER